ncbi:MAG: hypothetical protein OEM07_05415, partial [Gammaproteobacteria bacterium]|nr:hypothetical protein [Gammaproteobacteria bacterium]
MMINLGLLRAATMALLLVLVLPVSAVTMDDAKMAARTRDYPRMAAILKKLAADHDAEAQYQLANLY